MRFVTALMICLGLTASGLFALAQSSTSGPGTPASRTESANEPPRAPVPLSKTARRERAQLSKLSADVSRARVSRPRYRPQPGTGSPTDPTAATVSTFASH
jgi:hypothetical protein